MNEYPDIQRLISAVHAADGFLSLARHRPWQWPEIVRSSEREIDQAIGVLRRDVIDFLSAIEDDRQAHPEPEGEGVERFVPLRGALPSSAELDEKWRAVAHRRGIVVDDDQ